LKISNRWLYQSIAEVKFAASLHENRVIQNFLNFGYENKRTETIKRGPILVHPFYSRPISLKENPVRALDWKNHQKIFGSKIYFDWGVLWRFVLMLNVIMKLDISQLSVILAIVINLFYYCDKFFKRIIWNFCNIYFSIYCSLFQIKINYASADNFIAKNCYSIIPQTLNACLKRECDIFKNDSNRYIKKLERES
jgi:hypothetical protein